jgi:hypothetical protein
MFNPETLTDALVSGPRIILLDKSLVPEIPSQFFYKPITRGRSMEIGLIARK